MRKMRLFFVALIVAALSITAVAYAANQYNVTAKVPAGGKKKKPKAVGFSFDFTVVDDAGNVPQVIKEYSLGIEGTQVNTKVAKACTAAKINAAGSDDSCPSKANIGSGSVSAVVGTAGQPLTAETPKCNLKLTIYNAGTNKAALFLKGGPGEPGAECIAPISQAIDAKWVKKNGGTALVFTVPDELRHQVGLDVPVISVKSKLKKVVGKVKGKKRGYFESVGCTDKNRTVIATFTDESGTATPVTQDIGKC